LKQRHGLGLQRQFPRLATRVVFAMGREQALPGSLARLSRRQTPVVAIGCLAVLALALGLPFTYAYGGPRTFGYLASAGGLPVVLVYLAVNIAVIRVFRTEFRDQFRLGRHLLIPAAAVVVFLFPLWGIIRPPTYTLVNLLPFIALGWLGLGAVAVAILRARTLSPPGVLAAGDVRHGSVKRVASAAGEGSIAVTQVTRYLRQQNSVSGRQA
jgi:amino acid transporter